MNMFSHLNYLDPIRICSQIEIENRFTASLFWLKNSPEILNHTLYIEKLILDFEITKSLTVKV